jgi:hypothetical protein
LRSSTAGARNWFAAVVLVIACGLAHDVIVKPALRERRERRYEADRAARVRVERLARAKIVEEVAYDHASLGFRLGRGLRRLLTAVV